MSTQQSAPTSYITADDGVRYAYRLLEPSPAPSSSSSSSSPSTIPLVMHIHFRANMDFWDPALINPLAARRPVLLFDQAGVGRSTGSVGATYTAWAASLIALVRALRIPRFDLCGFSMGGRCVQMVALARPDLVRRLIIAGSDASEPPPPSSETSEGKGGEVVAMWPREVAPSEPIRLLSSAAAGNREEMERAIAVSFFPDSDAGRKAARMYFERIYARRSTEEEETPMHALLEKGNSRVQRMAAVEWAVYNPRNSFDRLRDLRMPVLVMNGSDDLLIPTSRSWECAKRIANAKLIIYPQSGHGFLWQYAGHVARDINAFLGDDDELPASSRL